uniref:Uncharacterized protein n=1 Tax=Tanacetum cinerariifolium TaxID=118510 RepID=A0A699H2P1_TANCI|nr:hypothetical protein [Tanacetum cinerariifolium]
MAYFPRLDELVVAANSRGLFEGMLVYSDRENARDLEFENEYFLMLRTLRGLISTRENTREKKRVKVSPLVPKVSIRHVDPKEFKLDRWSLSRGNSNNLTDAMSVYIQREINADLQFAVGLSQLWDVLYNRVNEIKMLSSELNLFGGPLAVQYAEYLKKFSKIEVLRMLELRKTIAEVHIQVHKTIDFLIVLMFC